MWVQISAFAVCLFAAALAVPTFGPLSGDDDAVAERRTFRKHTRRLPLLKKHKKFGGWLPHIFGKTRYASIPTPVYKVHRYHGLQLKPVPEFQEVSYVSSPQIVESHDFVDFDERLPTFPEHDFEEISGVPPTVFPQHISYPVQFGPVVPTQLPPAPFPLVSPVHFSTPQPPVNAWPSFNFPTPVPPISVPKPIVPNVQSFHNSIAVSTTPAPPVVSIASFPAKVPTPSVTPAPPLLPPLSLPTAFESLPLALPSPPSLPPLSFLPSVTTAAPAAFHADNLQPGFPYTPSGVPVPSFVKDVSLTTPLPDKVEPVLTHAEEGDIPKVLDHTLTPPRPDASFFQKIKGWTADKTATPFGNLQKLKPFSLGHGLPVAPKPIQLPTLQAPVPQNLHFPGAIPPPSIKPPQSFLPIAPSPAPFLPTKYESFPPYPAQKPQQIFNSYGVPIPHDSYGPPHHIPHDRVSSAASEEKSSVVPAPSTFAEPAKVPEREYQNHHEEEEQQQQQQSQFARDYLPPNVQKVQQHALPSDVHPVYKPEGNKTDAEDVNEEVPEAVRSINPEESFEAAQTQIDQENQE